MIWMSPSRLQSKLLPSSRGALRSIRRKHELCLDDRRRARIRLRIITHPQIRRTLLSRLRTLGTKHLWTNSNQRNPTAQVLI